MNTTVCVASRFPPRLILAFVMALTAGSAHAISFESESGEVKGSFDTTLSLGATWRMQDRDPSLIGITNGGTARDVNSDDGNLNYNKKGVVYSAVKATHDFDLSYRNYGMFLRGSYFFDPVNETKNFLGPVARDRMVDDVNLLDAYVRGTFDVGGRNLNLRLGSQVVSWGESTFILNGINAINPVDVSKLRVPGAELKEGLTPSNMLWASQEVSRSVTVEGFVLANWDKTRIDPRGSFFSTTDVLSDDGDKIFIGSGRRVDQHKPQALFGVIPGFSDASAPVWAPRSADRNPDDSGQFGLALRWFTPALNNTEFGFFAMNYHSRTPFLTAVRGAATVTGLDAATAGALAAGGCTPASTLVNFNAMLNALGANPGGNPLGQGICVGGAAPLVQANYFADYPKDIHLVGLSFNTLGPAGIAFQGEYSYRSNQPVQLATTEIILAAGGLANNITSNGLTGAAANTAAAGVVPGTEITGYRRVKMHQLQFTGTKAFGPTLGSEQLVILGEAGYNRQDLTDGLLFAGPGVFLPAVGSNTATTSGSTQPNMEGYATRSSWGYRLVGRLDYPNAIGAVTVSPRLAYAHDVEGVSATFNEGTKAGTLGVGFNYRQNLQADIAYTWFWGGRTYSGTDPGAVPAGQISTYASSANPLKDRDFLAVSLSYSF
ncbi:MAG: DUF1302 domain-containing protein [Gammaproteobacteria bacterium]|nr:DUF1302 domain-containing protein [Gammaproteobacteria bacterium]MDH3370954.1 DUF1302 domain-containing protein [Gammaproteobacteria bacterium]MDH3405748.1 DUF1302 domain-containing protein [Gammaproteobacteria bacterium]